MAFNSASDLDFGTCAVNHIHDIAKKLFVRHAVSRFGRKFHLRSKMSGQFAEQFHASDWIKFLPAQKRLQRNVRLRRSDVLPEPRCQMRKLPERIEFSRQHLIQIGFGNTWIANDYRVGGDVAQPLAFCNSAST